jgi:hypothetical protein
VSVGESLAVGARVSLRPLTLDDTAAVEPWLAEAVAAIDGSRLGADTPASLAEFLRRAGTVWPDGEPLLILAHGEATGLLVWRPGPPGQGAIVALAVRADRRNVGLGVEAVMRLEARTGLPLYAANPRTNGLAVYFWLRAGYRPVTVAEDGVLARDPLHLWLVRRR